ncbi:tetratricopeptide repeat-containing sulfotransferase family protein [Pseudoalteromonas denitrificans]|uniref:TPR repeat-containing protein n=1 Tax=Pseudoalteromonas denitrificans DSM 6059 TaxID=1123010 RepID=A0A1I1GL84_9GAMM|nr:sulfotransferase [Pseudoalteromonas denitrificans]SFC12236.1 TPR repeat-containing protein [Pseudoalteromonas denitrificans DSM 6059]
MQQHDALKLHHQAQVALNKSDLKNAHKALVALLHLEPEHADAYFLLAMVNLQVGQLKKAIALILKALSFDKQDEYLAQLAKCYAIEGDLKNAKSCIKHVQVSTIKSALVADTFAVALSHLEHHKEAIKFFEHALMLDNSNSQFYYNYGVSCKFIGDFNKAETAFEQAIKITPDHYQAHFALSDLGNTRLKANHIERLKIAFNKQTHADALLHLGHALAKEYEHIGDYENAFHYLDNCKSNKLKSSQYDFSEFQNLFTHVKNMSKKVTSNIGCISKEPIFILGMPRSGTTLVERIISSHDLVTSAGELQDFGMSIKELTQTNTNKVLDIETITQAYDLDFTAVGTTYLNRTRTVTGSTPHFIDKLPFNFFYVDLIRRVLPNAKIICLLRNPMDTCIGNYRQLFTINNPYYGYAFDLNTTAKFYSEFYQLIQHWQAQNNKNFMTLKYEELVSDPEQKIKQILNFCDLPFQKSCLDFHKNTAAVSTASKIQVREPINLKSIDRWKKYQAHTAEAQKILSSQGIKY